MSKQKLIGGIVAGVSILIAISILYFQIPVPENDDVLINDEMKTEIIDT